MKQADEHPLPGDRSSSFLPLALIIGAGLLIYARTVFFGFSYLDDNWLILDHHYLIKDVRHIFQAFKEDAFHLLTGRYYYRPLLTVSFVLDAQLSGTSPWAYHATNILIHLASACLVYGLFKKLKLHPTWALCFSLFFVAHPSLTQAVAWVPGRNDSLLAVFVISSFLLFANYLDSGSEKLFLGHILFWILALLTKETAIVLPILCLMLALIKYKEDKTPTGMSLSLPCWVIIGLSWYFIRASILNNPREPTLMESLLLLLRNSPAIVIYLGKILFPVDLSVYPILENMSLWYGWAAITVLMILLAASQTRNLLWVLFGWGWFLLFLIPPLSKPPTSTSVEFLDHRIYVSFIGLGVVLSTVRFKWLSRLTFKFESVSVFLVLAVLSGMTIAHCNNFKNRLAFWRNAVATSPQSAFAHNNLGVMYYLDNLLEEAEKEWREAIKINPSERLAHGNLGLVLMERGDLRDAEEALKQEIALNPLHDRSYFNLGLVKYRQKDYDVAVRLWKMTLKINPRYEKAYDNLLVHFHNTRDSKQAMYYYFLAQEHGVRVRKELKDVLNEMIP